MKNFKQRFIDSVTTYPKRYLLICLLILVVTIPSFLQMEMRFGTKIWFRSHDQHIVALEKFENTFGNDESIVIAFESKNGIFNQQELLDLKSIADKMWQVHDVVRVESLWNFYHSYANGDELKTEAFLDFDKLNDPTYLKNKQAQALDHKIVESYLIGKGAKSAFIYGRLKQQDESKADFAKVLEDVEKIINDYKNPSYYLYHIGSPTMNIAYKTTSFNDIRIILPILVALIMFYLFFSFKSIVAVIIPMSIVTLSVSASIALATHTGHKFNSLTLILPSVLIAVCIAYSVHLLNTYVKSMSLHGDKIRACKETLNKNMWPVFLTNITTVVGFFTLIPSDIKPISDLGIYAGCGTLFALLFTYIGVVPMLLFFNLKVKPAKVNPGETTAVTTISNFVKNYVSFLERRKYILLFLSIFTVGFLTFKGFQNEINSNPYKFFKPDHWLSISNEHILENMGGIGGPELVIDSGEEDGVKKPEFLKKVDQLSTWLSTQPEINKVLSIVDILKEMNQALMGGDPVHYKINDERATIAEELFLYTVSLPQGLDINNRVDFINRNLRMTVLWKIQDSKASMSEIEKIEAKAKELGLNLYVTGKAQLFQRMNSYIVGTFTNSMVGALLLISFIMALVFKSIKIGLFSMIPNVLPILMGAGILDLLHKPIDMGCAIVASITLGIAVDDTIHFLNHYQIERKKGKNIVEALEDVLESTGKALVITSVILVSSFGLFMFGNLVTNVNFGLLMAVVLGFALLCDLFILPVLLLLRHKK